MHIIFLALGTNLGDRSAALQAALRGLPPAIQQVEQSTVYETPPWGLAEQPPFLNMVVRGGTLLNPHELLEYLKKLETRLGRLPSVRWGPRLIDIDILFYDDLVLRSPELSVPHPHLQERAFVLVPLMDLAPDLVHPVLGETIQQLAAKVEDTGVKPYDRTD